MPLLDHFHPPLQQRRHWEGFHTMWAGSIVRLLNGRLLPPGYFADATIHLGSQVEVDVGTFEELPGTGTEPPGVRGDENGGGTATLAAPAWAPPAPGFEIPGIFPDSIEVLVYNDRAGPAVVAAVEFVSPRNKDRADARRAFVSKCAAYLQQGIGLVVVDVVTDRSANLHNELTRLLGQDARAGLPSAVLYAVGYRPIRRPKDGGTGGDAGPTEDVIQVWPATLAVGGLLPVVPLALLRGPTLPLDLEATYSETCRELRIT